ncbi:MAG: hypothetical protein WD069_15910 [Planctomycetales bacterium]
MTLRGANDEVANMADELLSEDFRVDIGRAANGRDFLRVVHLPKGRQRTVIGRGTAREIAHELASDLLREIAADDSIS